MQLQQSIQRINTAHSASLAYILHTTKRSTLALMRGQYIHFYQLTPNVAQMLRYVDRYTTERIATDAQLTLARKVAFKPEHKELIQQVYTPLSAKYTSRYLHICRTLSLQPSISQ